MSESSPSFSGDLFELEMRKLGGQQPVETIVHRTTGSTSSDLMKLVKNGCGQNVAVVADHQTGGRGRTGNTWYSPETGNLYISVSVSVSSNPPGNLPLVPLAAGASAAEALNAAGFNRAELKWPNDLLVNKKKLGGILCEAPDPTRNPVTAVVGLGLNISDCRFPDELKDTAICLDRISLLTCSREFLAAAWVNRLQHWCNEISAGHRAQLIKVWNDHAEPFGRRVRVGAVEGFTKELQPDGQLIVLQDDGNCRTVPGGIVENLD